MTIMTRIVLAINSSQWSNYIELGHGISALQKLDALDSLTVLMCSGILSPLNISHVVFTYRVKEVPALILVLAALDNLVKRLYFTKGLLGWLTKQMEKKGTVFQTQSYVDAST